MRPRCSKWGYVKVRSWRSLICYATLATIACSSFLFQYLEESGRLPYRAAALSNAFDRLSGIFTQWKYGVAPTPLPSTDIVIVEIDSESIDRIGRWPWPRPYVAYLIHRLFELGAGRVGLDLIFSEPQEMPADLREELEKRGLSEVTERWNPDDKLAKVIEQYADRLVLSWTTESPCQPKYDSCGKKSQTLISKQFERFGITPPSDFEVTRTPVVSAMTVISSHDQLMDPTRHQGFANGFRDADGVIRHTVPLFLVSGQFHSSLPLELARLAMNQTIDVKTKDNAIESVSLQPSGKTIPISPSGRMAIRFRGPERTYQYIPAHVVLGTDGEVPFEGKILVDWLRGKTVLVGASAIALGDRVATPLDAAMPGVEVHATILDNLLSMDALSTLASVKFSGLWTLFILLLMGCAIPALMLAVEKLSGFHAIAAVGSLMVLCAGVDLGLFIMGFNLNISSLYLQLAVSIGIVIVQKYLWETFDRQRAEMQALEKEKALEIEKLVKERMEGELKTAQLVQETLLSVPNKQSDLVEIESFYQPASECGGDLWDVHLDGERLSVFLGDATGHGASAAIVTAVIKSALTSIKAHLPFPRPEQCLTELNQILFACCKGRLAMTMYCVQLDLTTGSMITCNAGHESPMQLVHQESTSKVTTLFGRGEPLGYHAEVTYESSELSLAEGDTLFIFTDGISEARSPEGRAWGERALRKALQKVGTGPLSEGREALLSELWRYTKKTPQPDDLTFLLLRWRRPATVRMVA